MEKEKPERTYSLASHNAFANEPETAQKSILNSMGIDLGNYIGFTYKAIEHLEQAAAKQISLRLIEQQENRWVYQLVNSPSSSNKKQKKDWEKIQEAVFNKEAPLYHDNSCKTRIQLSDRNIEQNTITIKEDLGEDAEVYLRGNTYQLQKQLDAFHTLRDAPQKEHEPLIKLFSNPYYQSHWFEERYNGDIKVEQWHILKDRDINGVDQQRAFVEKALRSQDFALLEGPPGSGKTTCIIELIMQCVKRGQRILLCSATHVAIDNVIERILTKYKDECEGRVLPLRIASEEGDIRKDKVKEYYLPRYAKRQKKKLRDALRSKKGTPQKLMYEALASDKTPEFDQMLIEASNLVAGSMVGILKCPTIENNIHSFFDVMIVDEASKVTFADFLIPALHAKKWILVGDVQQLSPYVEDDYMAHYLDHKCRRLDKELHVAMTETYKWAQRLPTFVMPVLLLPEESTPEAMNKTEWLYLDKAPVPSDHLYYQLNSAKAVIAYDNKATRQFLEQYLDVPAKMIHFNEEGSFPQGFLTRQAYANRKKPKKGQGVDSHGIEHVLEAGQWENGVCRLLNQQYMFRTKEELRKRADEEFEWLVPVTAQEIARRAKYIAMPSILELLQRGTGAEKQNKKGNDIQKFLWQGFTKQEGIKKLKFQSLEYQHRMVGEIASLPSEQFYHGENLRTANTVAKRPNLMQGYFGNEAPVVWVNAASKGDGEGYSEKEVNQVRHELKLLLKHPTQKKLEVAVLSFYRKQESELRKQLREYTSQHKNYRNFIKGNLKITLCTVDQFQGDEADVVLLTFAKYTRGAFYNSPNRLNVALTRARFKLVLFGNREWFIRNQPSEAMKQLAEHYTARQKGKNNSSPHQKR